MKLLLTLFILLDVCFTHSQVLSLNNLVTAVSVSPSRADKYISQRNFFMVRSDRLGDTVIHFYQYKRKKQNKKDSTERSFSRYAVNSVSGVIYKTSSLQEFNEIKNQLKEGWFTYAMQADSLQDIAGFFQKGDMTAHTGIGQENEEIFYTIRVQKVNLPVAREILFAEDLLAFTSHENLAYVFGKNNVKKDLYFFTEKEFNHCSILFPNTPRQAVFIWRDEMNNYGLQYIVFGGQLMVQSALNYDQIVGENNWTLKSKIHAGMSLTELRRFHGDNFTFYSGRSVYSGMVIPAERGNINFKKEGVVLACLNCNDSKFFERDMMTADEAILQGRRFFILSIILYPDSQQ